MASSHETGSIAIIQKAGGVLQPLPHGELFEKAQAATAAVGASISSGDFISEFSYGAFGVDKPRSDKSGAALPLVIPSPSLEAVEGPSRRGTVFRSKYKKPEEKGPNRPKK